MLERVFAKLWWSPAKRPVRGVLFRLFGRRTHVLVGPLKGKYYGQSVPNILGFYELEIQEMLLKHLEAGHTFYDIGANQGYFLLLGSQLVTSTGKVVAVEPFPENIERLNLVTHHNQIKNGVIVPKAVSDDVGEMTLYFAQDSHATPSLVNSNEQNQVQVMTTTLDVLVSEHGVPDFVKIDVEGAEVAVINGAKALLQAHKNVRWLIEVHSADKLPPIESAFAQNGYSTRIWEQPKSAERFPLHLTAWHE